MAKIVTKFPRKVREIENVFIPLKDGTRLAARIWLPDDAEKSPVPAILEYLPYRKRDGTVERDHLTHPYFAGHGYAGVRVDIRGSGDSDGILYGEYLKQEQDDALEVIDWLAKQPWCSGTVGMIGISWGGFNGLQVAARRPKALKAVISLCSTDDRYNDDIHYMGGCLLVDEAEWGTTMFGIASAPPDPLIVGNKWEDMWVERQKKGGLFLENWMRHQRRDDFYKHGSVCEDWDAIQCAVYAVGGWADGYSNTVLRLLANLKSPVKGLIGPWGHKYPHFARPGPQIGFLQECLRWWDQWLKGKETGIMKEPALRVWMEDPAPPQAYYHEKPGRWVAEESWPSTRIKWTKHPLHHQALGAAGAKPGKGKVSISSPLDVGAASGHWCSYGVIPDQPLDQRMEAGGSLLFNSEVLKKDVEILGPPTLHLEVSADRSVAQVAVCLNEVLPDGQATRITYGLLNLTHRESHEHPTALVPGKKYKVRVQLNDIAHRFGKGNRIQVAVSNAYFPIAFPSPEKTTLTIELKGSRLDLPTRPKTAADAKLPAFKAPESAAPAEIEEIEKEDRGWEITHDIYSGYTTTHRWANEGKWRTAHVNLVQSENSVKIMRVKPNDPATAELIQTHQRSYERGAWKASSDLEVRVLADKTHFNLSARLSCFSGDREVFSNRWEKRFKRDLV